MKSKTLPITSGVPQGSILAPTLFQIFINDLLSLPKHFDTHAYADDTTFYISGKENLQKHINQDIASIEQWCLTNKMALNLSKSHFLIINPPQNASIDVIINQHPLAHKKTSTLLGFTLNNVLTWSDHIQTVINKVASNIRLFYNIRHLMNYTTAKTFYYNFIHPHLTYGIHIFYPLTPAKDTLCLYKLQKKALRLICINSTSKQNHLPSTTGLSKQTSILPLPKLALYFSNLVAQKILYNNCPSYLTQPFTTSHSNYLTRNQFKLPSSSAHNKLNLHLLKSFNSLPFELRQIKSNSLFKRKLKTYYLTL